MEETKTSVKNSNAGDVFLEGREYWLDKLSGELVKSNFPYDHKTDVNDKHHTQKERYTLDGEIFTRLMQLRNNSDPRLHMVLVAAINILIHRCIGIDDIIVGTTIDKQDSDEEFINTLLPLRNRIEDHTTFKQFLLQVKNSVSGAVENQNYSIEELFNQLTRVTGGHIDSLFDVVVLLENIQDKKYLHNIQPAIIFSFTRSAESIQLEVEYQASLYKKDTIQQIIKQFALLLEKVIFNVDIELSSIELLTPEEKKELVIDFNNTGNHDPDKKTVHELFEARAAETPGAVALILEGREVSYGELNREANRLARILVAMEVARETIVGFIFPPSIEAVIGILGILKAGGAFLPIAPDLPMERVNYILKDSETELVLTTKALLKEKYLSSIRVLLMDELLDGAREGLNREDDRCLEIGYELSNLAYIIYTSGTTGSPKGVLIEHGALVNYTRWASRQYVKSERSNFSLYSSFSFDLTVTSIFTPLVTGNTIFIYRGEEKEFLIEKIFDDNKVEIVKLTPVHLMLTGHRDGSRSQIKRFIVGGEKLETQLVQRICANFKGDIEIYNEYGPTEATVGCMIHKFNPRKDNTLSIPIGRPADNVQIYLMDQYDKNVPLCGIGELYIGGRGLARGYLNSPDLTTERFIRNPFKSGEKLYKTGDMARRLADGNIEFLGRVDQQVKIRGYRIEISEVERCLLKHERIDHAVVLAKDGGDGYKLLVAYIVPAGEIHSTGLGEMDGEIDINVKELRSYLSGYLPEFMIPSYFVQLGKIPITANGKLDMKSLPDPVKNVADTGVQYKAPSTELEKILVEIWQDVMGVDKIGINDNYFALGGDSIKSIQILARLHNVGWNLELRDLFQYSTIKELVHYVKPLKEIPNQEMVEGEVKLTPIQKWFFENNFTDEHHFNLSIMFYRPEGFDEEILKKVFSKLVEHHDALRLVFKREEGKIKQISRRFSDDLVNIEIFDMRNENNYKKRITGECSRIQGSIDLSGGPLVKPGLFKTKKGVYLLIPIHHLVVDTVSWRFLFEDFTSLYKQIEKGIEKEKLEIPFKSTSYKEWAEKLCEYSNSEELLEELKYWQKIENTENTELFDYFKNKGRIMSKNKDSRKISFTLPEKSTEKLLKQVNNAYNTEINDILLAALGLAVSDWVGVEKVPLTLEGHGREEILPGVDITRTVGWFTSMYPVVLDIKNRDDIASIIKDTKEMLRNIPCKGFGYGILRYLTGEENKQNIKFRLNPGISFNYLGQFEGEKNSESFQVADISPGDSTSLNIERIYPIDILGRIFRGELGITMNYDGRSFEENDMRIFLDGYERRLLQIIDHCTAKQDTEFTLSDYSVSIAEQEADLVFDILSDIKLDG